MKMNNNSWLTHKNLLEVSNLRSNWIITLCMKQLNQYFHSHSSNFFTTISHGDDDFYLWSCHVSVSQCRWVFKSEVLSVDAQPGKNRSTLSPVPVLFVDIWYRFNLIPSGYSYEKSYVDVFNYHNYDWNWGMWFDCNGCNATICWNVFRWRRNRLVSILIPLNIPIDLKDTFQFSTSFFILL